MDQELREPR